MTSTPTITHCPAWCTTPSHGPNGRARSSDLSDAEFADFAATEPHEGIVSGASVSGW